MDKRFQLASPTGAELSVCVWPAQGAARGVVQINHGFAEHAGRYARFGAFLASRGYHAYAHDHRGHGLTRAPDASSGRFAQSEGVDKVIADVVSVHDRIAADHPGLPVVAFGHSMGGLITLSLAQRHSDRLAGAAVWNANFSAGLLGRLALGILRWEAFRLGSDATSLILPKLTFRQWGAKVPGHRTLTDWLSRDTAEVDKYIADPLCGWDGSVSMWRDVFHMILDGADDRRFADVRRALPFNLVGGGRDPSTDNAKAVRDLDRRLRAMGFSSLQTKIYPENRHESLNELNRDEVMADFADWLDRAIPAR